MNCIALTDEHLENIRREMMKAAAQSLEIAADHLQRLGDAAPWGSQLSMTLTGDTLSVVTTARVDLASLEALGWPES